MSGGEVPFCGADSTRWRSICWCYCDGLWVCFGLGCLRVLVGLVLAGVVVVGGEGLDFGDGEVDGVGGGDGGQGAVVAVGGGIGG